MPKYLAEAAARTDARALREWMARVSEVVQSVAERWDLRLGDPYEPGGQCSWVAPVLNACGEHLVLKVGWRHPEAAHEADALRSWAGAGAVELRAAETFDQTSALLLERCIPGTPLGHSMPEPDQDLILARLLGFCQRLAGLLDLDAERVRQWLFSRCVQESTHRPLLHDIAIRIAP